MLKTTQIKRLALVASIALIAGAGMAHAPEVTHDQKLAGLQTYLEYRLDKVREIQTERLHWMIQLDPMGCDSEGATFPQIAHRAVGCDLRESQSL